MRGEAAGRNTLPPLFETATSQSPGLSEILATAYDPGMCLLALPVTERRRISWKKQSGGIYALSQSPTFCAFILGFIIPFIMGIWLSFCEFTTVTDAKFVGLSNYVEAFKDTVFRHSFWYTVLFAVISLIVINVVAFALAMALTQKMKGTNIFRTIFFMRT